MSYWPDAARTVASTIPVRIAPTTEGWIYLGGLVAAERKFDALLPALRKVTPEMGEFETPVSYTDGDGPKPPYGIIKPFREEWSHDADGTGRVSYFAVDGESAGGGAY